jgi:hypothetical protein
VTVRFGRLQAKGLLLGFSGARVGVLAGGLVLVVPALFFAGLPGVLTVSPAAGSLIASAFVPVAGRVAVEWLPVAGHWWLRRLARQTVFLVRPMTPRPAGTLALPGDAAALRVHVDEQSGAAMVFDPHRRTLTATAVVSHRSFVLLGTDEQQRRVSAWGRVLAVLAATEQIATVQVLEASVPDTGSQVAGYWQQHRTQGEGWVQRCYGDLVASAAPASSRHRSTISITLDLARAARVMRRHGRGLAAAAAVLRQDMQTLTVGLRAGDLSVTGWLGPGELARLLRGAYDPTALRTEHPTSIPSGGPVGVDEHWDYFLADNDAYSAVLWISEWPRSDVTAGFLHPLILKAGVCRSFSLVARPLSTREAMHSIRRQKVDYLSDAAQKARLGQIADLSDRQEYEDLLQRERELLAGHTDLSFAGFLAVTAASHDELDSSLAELERAAITAGCETRRLVGQQTQAFTAAALPLGRGL